MMHINETMIKLESLKRQRKALLITGMYRSGGSVTAAVLCHLGAAAPATITTALPFNESTSWESHRFHNLNDRILAEAGSSPYDILPIEQSFFKSDAAISYVDEICSAIEAEYGKEPLICIKDPQLSRLLPLWILALNRLKIEPIAIITLRNPLEVAASLKEYNNFSLPYSQFLWLRYMIDCEAHSQGLRRIFVSYEDFLSDWRRCVTHITNKLDLTFPKFQTRSASRVEQMISNRLRHHVSSTEKLESHSYVSPLVKSVSRTLMEAASGNRPDPHEPLSEIATQLEVADRLYAELLAEKEFKADTGHSSRGKPLTSAGDREGGKAGVQKKQVISLASAEDKRKQLKSMVLEATHQVTAAPDETNDVTAEMKIAPQKDAPNAQSNNSVLKEVNEENKRLRAEISDLNSKIDASIREKAKLANLFCEAEEKAESTSRDFEKEAEKYRNRIDLVNSEMTKLSEDFRDYKMIAAKSIGALILKLIGSNLPSSEDDDKMTIISKKMNDLGVFDCYWYLNRYSDVAEARVDPVYHYLIHGISEGRLPCDLNLIAEKISISHQITA